MHDPKGAEHYKRIKKVTLLNWVCLLDHTILIRHQWWLDKGVLGVKKDGFSSKNHPFSPLKTPLRGAAGAEHYKQIKLLFPGINFLKFKID